MAGCHDWVPFCDMLGVMAGCIWVLCLGWLGAWRVRLLGAVAVLGAMGGMPRSSVRRLGAILGWAW